MLSTQRAGCSVMMWPVGRDHLTLSLYAFARDIDGQYSIEVSQALCGTYCISLQQKTVGRSARNLAIYRTRAPRFSTVQRPGYNYSNSQSVRCENDDVKQM